MSKTVSNPYAKPHTQRTRYVADQSSVAFHMKQRTPRTKMLGDVRDREACEDVRRARRGEWED